MPSTLITAKGGFPDVQVLQMFRSISSRWGCELGACFLLWLIGDGMGLASAAAPLHPTARSPVPVTARWPALAWVVPSKGGARRGGKESLGKTPLC